MLLSAYVLMQQGKARDALQVIDMVAEVYPQSYMPHYLRGFALEQADQAEGARASYERVLKLCPRHRLSRAALVRVTK